MGIPVQIYLSPVPADNIEPTTTITLSNTNDATTTSYTTTTITLQAASIRTITKHLDDSLQKEQVDSHISASHISASNSHSLSISFSSTGLKTVYKSHQSSSLPTASTHSQASAIPLSPTQSDSSINPTIQKESTNLVNTSQIGLAVGIPIGVMSLLLLSFVGYFYFKSRKKSSSSSSSNQSFTDNFNEKRKSFDFLKSLDLNLANKTLYDTNSLSDFSLGMGTTSTVEPAPLGINRSLMETPEDIQTPKPIYHKNRGLSRLSNMFSMTSKEINNFTRGLENGVAVNGDNNNNNNNNNDNDNNSWLRKMKKTMELKNSQIRSQNDHQFQDKNEIESETSNGSVIVGNLEELEKGAKLGTVRQNMVKITEPRNSVHAFFLNSSKSRLSSNAVVVPSPGYSTRSELESSTNYNKNNDVNVEERTTKETTEGPKIGYMNQILEEPRYKIEAEEKELKQFKLRPRSQASYDPLSMASHIPSNSLKSIESAKSVASSKSFSHSLRGLGFLTVVTVVESANGHGQA